MQDAHAADIPQEDQDLAYEQDAQRTISDQEFDGFLDDIMGRLYDSIKEHKPQQLAPTLTMYRRRDYGQPFQANATQVPPVDEAHQIPTFEQLGASAAEMTVKDGHVPVAAFMVSLGHKVPPQQIGGGLTAQDLENKAEEVIMICGTTIDGRVNQAIYKLSRNTEKRITAVDLHLYVMARKQKTVQSTLRNGYLEAFYRGHAAGYNALMEQRNKTEGGTKHGDFIIPD